MRVITLSQISGGEAMFDGFLETQTSTADAIEKTFDVTGKNAVAIFNTSGVEASLAVGGQVMTVSLLRDSIKDWWDYWFARVCAGRDVVFYFPTQPSASATLTISYPDGVARCGLCVTGVAKEIATTEWDVSVGISDYSKMTTDGFGRTYLVPGKWAKRARAGLFLLSENVDSAYREIVNNRARPTIFDYNEYPSVGLFRTSADGFQSLIVYGYTEDFEIGTPTYGVSRAVHEGQGLT